MAKLITWNNEDVVVEYAKKDSHGQTIDVQALNDRISNLEGKGRFLSLWNADTGVAMTNPPSSPYTYKTGDYFIVGVSGSKIPTGSSYSTGETNYETSQSTFNVGNFFVFDGTYWQYQTAPTVAAIGDVQVNGTSIVHSGIANITNQLLNLLSTDYNYDETKASYNMWDYCFYNGKLYRAKTSIIGSGGAVGAFDPTKWEERTFLDFIANPVFRSIKMPDPTFGSTDTIEVLSVGGILAPFKIGHPNIDKSLELDLPDGNGFAPYGTWGILRALDLGILSQPWRNLRMTGKIIPSSAGSYGLVLPSPGSSADKTLATTDQIRYQHDITIYKYNYEDSNYNSSCIFTFSVVTNDDTPITSINSLKTFLQKAGYLKTDNLNKDHIGSGVHHLKAGSASPSNYQYRLWHIYLKPTDSHYYLALTTNKYTADGGTTFEYGDTYSYPLDLDNPVDWSIEDAVIKS